MLYQLSYSRSKYLRLSNDCSLTVISAFQKVIPLSENKGTKIIIFYLNMLIIMFQHVKMWGEQDSLSVRQAGNLRRRMPAELSLSASRQADVHRDPGCPYWYPTSHQ